jgi:hypothetical protein
MSKQVQHETVKFKLSDVDDEELRTKLEHKFLVYENLKREQVKAIREAQRAAARGTMALAEVQLSESELLIEASEAFDLISTEPAWIIRRSPNGAVIFECMLTQTDIQNVQRGQIKQMKEQIKPTVDDDDDEDDSASDEGMFRKE